MNRFVIISMLGLLSVSCAVEPRQAPIDSQVWSDEPNQRSVSEPVSYEPRMSEMAYGLPSQSSTPNVIGIGDLIARLPSDGPGSDGLGAGVFHSDRMGASAWSCPAPNLPRTEDNSDVLRYFTLSEPWSTLDAFPTGDPIVIEGVVTLHPRQYMKVPVCGQGERNYGAFVVEDDTGGMIILRDSRIAPFSMGDRVRVTLDSVIFPPPGLRNLMWMGLTARIEPVKTSQGSNRLSIYYSPAVDGFTEDDVGQTKQIEGFVIQQPSNSNFSELILGDTLPETLQIDEGVRTTLDLLCRDKCTGKCGEKGCGDPNGSCKLLCQRICQRPLLEGENFSCDDAAPCQNPNLGCKAGQCTPIMPVSLPDLELPQCWTVNLDRELVSRRYTYSPGARLRIRGPVVNSFGLKMWVQRLGQIEELNEN